MIFHTFIFTFLLSSLAYAEQSWSVAPKLDLMVFCESSEAKSAKDLEVVLDRARSDSDYIYIQILLQNVKYDTRNQVLLLLAGRPLKERQMAFKAALAWNNVWAPATRKRRRYDEYLKFIDEVIHFASDIGISSTSTDFLSLNRRRQLILQVGQQSDEVAPSKQPTERRLDLEAQPFTREVPASIEKPFQSSSAPLQSSSPLTWSAIATAILAFGWLLVRKLRKKS